MFGFILFGKTAFFNGLYLLICAVLLIGLAPKHYFSVVLLACCIGFVWSAYQARRIMRWRLALEEINRPVIITGRISTLPQSDPLGVHLNFNYRNSPIKSNRRRFV
ncbi:DUF4131 domain-containing protein [Coxiella burnetii]|uniref:DUF4131 domain-containing protein n=1 Tax=Coxiella burnetii TaxID=777 RepID=UPI00222E7ECF|nr:DUF4131 domain-containing protein [Coxiella burnetii]